MTVYLNGQAVAIWSATDENGNYVPNGVYHFVMQEHAADGSTVILERDAYVDPFHGESLAFGASPNTAGPGETIVFSASFAGLPADGQSKIKIYTVSGELVRVLSCSSGLAQWNLENGNGRVVSSGLYLAALEGKNPANGDMASKIVKVLITH